MIIRNEYRQFHEDALRIRIPDPSDCLFFDIETTGFKPDRTHLYLICLAEKIDDRWKIIQLFGEKPTEEAAILRTFAQLVRPYSKIVTFNGEQFDIGYLNDKYAAYGLESPLADKESIDLYRDLRTLRRFLQMPHMNQKSLETFLGLHRDDPYDGGQLIDVYRSYVKTASEDLLNTLLLHNFEDVCGMFTVTLLYTYRLALDTVPQQITTCLDPLLQEHTEAEAGLRAFLDSAFSEEAGTAEHPCRSVQTKTTGTARIDDIQILTISYPLIQKVPVPVHRVSKDYPLEVSFHEDRCTIQVPAVSGQFLYFMEPYKDYYYLPLEDEAVHKDIAVYVDKAHRQKATAATCYTHQSGTFLPQPIPHFQPALRRSYRDPLPWFRPVEAADDESNQLAEYACLLLRFVQ